MILNRIIKIFQRKKEKEILEREKEATEQNKKNLFYQDVLQIKLKQDKVLEEIEKLKRLIEAKIR